MKPLIKWAGGKRRFVKEISEYIPQNSYNRYIEPFLGSGALFFNLEPKEAILNDLNMDLINFYYFVKNNPVNLFDEINLLFNDFKNLEKESRREIYKKIRCEYNNLKNQKTIKKAAMFFFLNKVGFNGIYRVNSNGEFNVPIGHSKTFFIPQKEEFLNVSTFFKKNNIKFFNLSYEKIISEANKGDLIYLDPPYYPDETSKFVGYTDPSFREEEHEKMLEYCETAFKKGADIIISNSNSIKFKNLIVKKFGDNVIYKDILTKRSINPNAPNKERFIEKLYIIRKKEDKNYV